MKYDAGSETQILEKDSTVSILIYLHFSEADLGLLLEEENGLVGYDISYHIVRIPGQTP